MRHIHLLLLISTLILVSGCSSTETIRSGALNVIQTDFPADKVLYKRISSEDIHYRTVFGMSDNTITNNAETVNIFNFNGETIQSGVSGGDGLQFLTFLAAVASITIPFVNGGSQLEGESNVMAGILLGIIGGGLINEMIWKRHHYKNALGISNKAMIESDPKIDFYVNPSYSIRTQSGLLTSKHTIKANSIGVKLDDNLFIKDTVEIQAKNVIEHSQINVMEDESVLENPLNIKLGDKLLYTDRKGNEYNATLVFYQLDANYYQIRYVTKNGVSKTKALYRNQFDSLKIID